MHWITLPSGKRINLAQVFSVKPGKDLDSTPVLRVYGPGYGDYDSRGGLEWLYGADIPAMLAALDRVSMNAVALDEPTCTRCNQPLGHDGYGEPIGDTHYGCAVNEREMWGRR